jgi:hypothetical protein
MNKQMKAKITALVTGLKMHADRHANLADAFDAQAKEATTEQAQKEAKASAKWHRTHAKADTLLALSGENALAQYIAMTGHDADKADAHSREFKERATVVFSAIGNSTRIDCDRKHGDRAADAAVQFVLSSNVRTEYSLPDVQTQMAHETTTQAGYFGTFLEVCGGGAKVKGGFVVNRTSALWQVLAKCYGVTMETAQE